MRIRNALVALAVSAGLAATPAIAGTSSVASAAVSAPVSAVSVKNLRAGSKVRKSEKQEIDRGAAIALGAVALGLVIWCVADFCKGGRGSP